MESTQPIQDSLRDGLLYQALRQMRSWLKKSGANAQWEERLNSIQQNYNYLVQYFLSGQDDPNRARIFNHLTIEAYALFDDMNNQRDKEIVPRLATRIVSNEDHQDFNTFRNTFYTFAINRNWYDITPIWEQMVRDGDTKILQMATSGIILSCLDHFSEAKIVALLDDILIYPPQVQYRVVVGVLIVLIAYGERMGYYDELNNRLQILYTDGYLHTLLLRAVQYFLETSLTPRVDKEMMQMQEDILPAINKQDRNKPIVLNLEEIEEGNPAWTAAIRDSMEKHVDAMSRLIHEGADFTYTSCRSMLNDPFFREEVAHYFMPFDTNNPQIGIDFNSEGGSVVRVLINVNTEACDVDRYATCLVYKHLQGHLSNVIPPEVKEMGAMQANEAVGEEKMKFGLRSEVRNWYRFFHNNAFGYANLMKQGDEIASSLFHYLFPFTDEELVDLADHCLRLQLYNGAEQLLSVIEAKTAEVYQKLGFAYQKQEDKEVEAYICFNKALTIDDHDDWSRFHMAACLRKMNDFPSAVECYDRLLVDHPNKKSYLLQKAACLMEAKDYEKALQVYFQLDLLYPDELSIQRGLAWCAFVCDRQDTAERYLEQLAFSPDASSNDYLNYAHWLFVAGQRAEALKMYETASEKADSLLRFLRDFKNDEEILRQKGMSIEELALFEDVLVERITVLTTQRLNQSR